MPIDKVVFDIDSDVQLLGSDVESSLRLFGDGGILSLSEDGNFVKVADDKFINTSAGLTTGSIDNLKNEG